mmetsp:Transcript_46911/g.94717  ORF Transcript_46911/g.94717 Transcript_46911/m.94717 type:complete len:211 (-) Transcript_46911:54-686(-)
MHHRQHFGNGDEGEVCDDQIRCFWQGGQAARIDALHDCDPLVGPQTRRQLLMSNVDCEDAHSTAVQEDLREPPRGAAQVSAHGLGWVNCREGLQRMQQLERPTPHPVVVTALERDIAAWCDTVAGLPCRCTVDKHAAGGDKLHRALARRCEPPVHEQHIEALPSRRCVARRDGRLPLNSAAARRNRCRRQAQPRRCWSSEGRPPGGRQPS